MLTYISGMIDTITGSRKNDISKLHMFRRGVEKNDDDNEGFSHLNLNAYHSRVAHTVCAQLDRNRNNGNCALDSRISSDDKM